MMPHPSNSPDLNAAELMWNQWKNFVEEKRPSTKQELEDTIFDPWNQNTDELCIHCIDHIVPRIRQIVAIDGGWPSIPTSRNGRPPPIYGYDLSNSRHNMVYTVYTQLVRILIPRIENSVFKFLFGRRPFFLNKVLPLIPHQLRCVE